MSDPKREASKREVYESPRKTTAGNRDVRVVGGRTRHTFQLDECDADELLNFVALVVRNGDLCSFCQTSDGGALCVTVLCGQRQLKGYARSTDELVVRMTDLLEVLYA